MKLKRMGTGPMTGRGLSSEVCARIRERKGWDTNELLVLLHVEDNADADGHFPIEALRKFYDLRKDRSGRDVITRLVGNRVLTYDAKAGTVGLNPGPWDMERRGPAPNRHPEFAPEFELARALTRKDQVEGPRCPASAATEGPLAAAAAVANLPPPRSRPQLTVNSDLRKEGSIELLNGEQFTGQRFTAQEKPRRELPDAAMEARLMLAVKGFIARFHGPEFAEEDFQEWGGDWRKNWVRRFPSELADVLEMLTGEAEEQGWRPHKSAGAAIKDEVRRLVANRTRQRQMV